MTEISPYAPATVEQFSPGVGDPTGGRLVAWAEGLAAAHRIGTALCQTSFVPAQFRGKPEEAAAAILYGDEIGFTPTQALQNIYVISGKPSMYARSMVALLMSHGHEVWTVEKTDAKVTVAGRRKGSTHTVEETWTTARAAKAGYTNNKKYQTDPQAMLYARAASDVCRQVAPDSLAGIAYTVEEMELNEPVPVTRVARAKAEKPVTPEPEFEMAAEPVRQPEVTPEPDVAPEPVEEPALSKRQQGKLFALFTQKGIPEDQQKPGIEAIVGHPIAHRTSLTGAEFDAVVTQLEGLADAEGQG